MNRKKEFRKEAIRELKNSKTSKIQDKKIIFYLYRYIKYSNKKNIMLYLPLKQELNTLLLIKLLKRDKKRIFVPFMEYSSFKLVEFRLPLQKSKFGVYEPKNSYRYKIPPLDLAIVPIIGIDKTFRRIGFGKGMYDRFFEQNRTKIKETIFVTRKLCYKSEIITNSYDIRAEVVLTLK